MSNVSKITIYNRNGSTYRELECVDVQPHDRATVKMVILEKSTGFGLPDKHILTNLPFYVEDHQSTMPTPSKGEPCATVRLLSDDGEVIGEWLHAEGLAYLQDMVMFYSKGKWHCVCGNLYIQPEEKQQR